MTTERTADVEVKWPVLARRARDSEARYRGLFDASPDALLVTDGALTLREANAAAARLFGARLDEPGFASGLLTLRSPATVTGANGRSFAAEVSATQVEATDEWLISVRDVEERTRLERQGRELEERLRRSQRLEAVSRLVSGVAHDLASLLTLIGVSADELDRQHGSPETHDIREAAARGTALLRQMLQFGRRGEAPRQHELDPNVVARNTTHLLGRLLGRAYDIELRLAPDAGSVLGDDQQLGQVLLNLLLNARDAMPGGGSIVVSSGLVEVAQPLPYSGGTLAPGRYSVLSVQDAGTGLSPEVREHLFEPFFTTKPAGVGTGLGLAVSLGIVRDTGGAVVALPGPDGRGSVFQVFLPVV